MVNSSNTLLFTLESIKASIVLEGSKSISNRVLMIRRMCGEGFDIEHISASEDTKILSRLLWSDEEILDAGDAGTTFRFLTSYLCTLYTAKVLTGSVRMKQRPIGPLVSALRELGANIEYLEEEGFPPLKISPNPNLGLDGWQITIPGDISSQFISSLMLVAPLLPQGIEISIDGPIYSKPYIAMTYRIMQRFGANIEFEGNTISVKPKRYEPITFFVEGDWSAASYYFSICALSKNCVIELIGLKEDSLQGDAILVKIYKKLGVETEFTEQGIVIRKVKKDLPAMLEWDFRDCPDIAQTVSVTLAALGVSGLFSGLESLTIKETDRIAALKTELSKGDVSLIELPKRLSGQSDTKYYMQEGKMKINPGLRIDTYGDHRMAMAFAPLAIVGRISLDDPNVVKKSYRGFWNDLEKVGISLGE